MTLNKFIKNVNTFIDNINKFIKINKETEMRIPVREVKVSKPQTICHAR